ncbi:hypothetical protein VTI74DRAFT_7019 [Chaetomium olivicolor]
MTYPQGKQAKKNFLPKLLCPFSSIYHALFERKMSKSSGSSKWKSWSCCYCAGGLFSCHLHPYCLNCRHRRCMRCEVVKLQTENMTVRAQR